MQDTHLFKSFLTHTKRLNCPHCPKSASVITSLHDSDAWGPERCFSSKPSDWQKSSIITYSVGSQGILVHHQRAPFPCELDRQAHYRIQMPFFPVLSISHQTFEKAVKLPIEDVRQSNSVF